MNRQSLPLFIASLVLLALGNVRATAGPIFWDNPIAWSYQVEPSRTTIPADWGPLPLMGSHGAPILWPPFPGPSSLHLSDGGLQQAAGSSDIIAARVWADSNAPAWWRAHFTNAAYRLSLILTDEASGKSGVVTFKGLFNGTLWRNGANISNRFIGARSQTLILGLDVFTVTIGPYLAPGPHGWWDSGAIGAHVDVHFLEPPPWGLKAGAVQSGSAPVQSPEPSSLALAGMGLSALGLMAWRKWRGRMAVA